MECPECLGEGRVEKEWLIGGVGPAGPWQGYTMKKIECELCNGWGELEEIGDE